MNPLVDSGRRARVGDRMRVTVETTPKRGECEVISAVVTIRAVTHLGCGCDRAVTARPRSADGTCPDLHLLPAWCENHRADGIDFDQARTAAEVQP